MGASAVQQSQALAFLPPSRSLHRVRQATRRASSGPVEEGWVYPSAGALLRAMRLRRGFSLEMLAQSLGVTPTAASYWERSETLPDEDHLERLLGALGAAPEERDVLRRRNPAPFSSFLSPRTLEEIEYQFLDLRERVQRGERSLLDLRFLALEASLWPFLDRESARELLGRTYAWHARGLSWWDRTRETARYSRAALALLDGGPFEADWLEAVKAFALYEKYGRQKVSHERGMEALRLWLPHARTPEAAARIRSELADYASLAGENETALEWSNQALSAAKCAEDEDLLRVARSVRVNALVRVGRWEEAAATLPERFPAHPVDHQFDLLRNLDLYRRLGEKQAARESLIRAYAMVENYNLSPKRLATISL
jgi:transcriptional regulator with XRE-family HTH domain